MDFINRAFDVIGNGILDSLDRHPDERIGWDEESETLLTDFIASEINNMTNIMQQNILDTIFALRQDVEYMMCETIIAAFNNAPSCESVNSEVSRLVNKAKFSIFDMSTEGDLQKQIKNGIKALYDKSMQSDQIIDTLARIFACTDTRKCNRELMSKINSLIATLDKQLSKSRFSDVEEENC